MKNKLLKGGFVIGLIILFVGVSVLPITSGNIGKIVAHTDNVVSIDTKNFGNDIIHEDKTMCVDSAMATGSLKVEVKSAILRIPLGGSSVAIWDLCEDIWYAIPPMDNEWGSFFRDHLSPGRYLLRVICEGYLAQEEIITIEASQQTNCAVYLRPVLIKDSSNAEPVAVSAEAELELVSQHSINSQLLQFLQNLMQRFPMMEQILKSSPLFSRILNQKQ